MTPRLRSFLVQAGTIVFTSALVLLLVYLRIRASAYGTIQQAASAAAPLSASSSPALVTIIGSSSKAAQATSSTATTAGKTATIAPAKSQPTAAKTSTASNAVQIARVAAPYPTPPESFTQVNTDARAALVNILCTSPGGSLQSISGSGVIIDPRGIILTNAHVAQYVLLSESPQFALSCVIRTGSPAGYAWQARVMFIPTVWVDEHAQDINAAHPTGTGEHDYAFLRIVGATGTGALPASFPYVPVDTREAIAFLGDQVLGASYPAEFLGATAAEYDLDAVSSISNIDQLLTFGTSTVDVISLGGVIEAQSGSSGGAVVNAWGRLVGLITTTSEGTTTAQRDLRAITLSYIDRDFTAQSGEDLGTFLSGDPAVQEAAFDSNTAPTLINKYVQVLTVQQQQ